MIRLTKTSGRVTDGRKDDAAVAGRLADDANDVGEGRLALSGLRQCPVALDELRAQAGFAEFEFFVMLFQGR